jgi:hypothetical protein
LPGAGAPAAAWSVEDVAAAVASVVGSCERLQLQAVGLEAGFCSPQRLLAVALVERLVHEVLPLPRSAGTTPAAAAAASSSLWHERPPPSSFSGYAQTALLQSLGSLLRHYLAAVHSTAAVEGGGSVTLVTLCAVVTLLDAAARIPAADGAAPLTLVLTGSASPSHEGRGGGCATAVPPPRKHGVPIPPAALTTLTSERMLASPAVRRTRAAVAAYVAAINGAAGAVPFVDARAGGTTFHDSFKGAWPEYSPITLFADAAAATHGLAFMVDYLLVHPRPAGGTGAAADGEGDAPNASGGGLLLPLGQRMPPGLLMALKSSEHDSHRSGGGSTYSVPMEPQDIAPPLLATGWFAEGDIPGHEALVAYRDALIVFFIGVAPPVVC